MAFVALFIELVNWHLPLLRNRVLGLRHGSNATLGSQPGLLNLLFSKEFFTGHEVHRGDVQLLYLTAAEPRRHVKLIEVMLRRGSSPRS